jgi:adenylate cyclase
MSETRKLAAILAADVVGFSRLSATDEEDTQARVRALCSGLIEPTIANLRGRMQSGPATERLLEALC